MHKYFLFLIVSLVIVASCGSTPSTSPDPPTSVLPPDFPRKGVVHWRSFLEWDQTMIEEAARAELAIFPIQICLSDAGQAITGRMKEINPDIKIIGYQGLLMLAGLYGDTASVIENTPYEMDYHLAVRDHWAWTTTGDTLSMWPGSIFLNPFTDGEPDMEFMARLIDLLAEYDDDRPGAIDGIMHDYFMYRPYIGYGMEEIVTGDIDLDGNGILIGEDSEERAMFLQWQIDFASGIRERLGRDFIQIGNGKVPQEDERLASVINGIFYELYPNMRWNITDLAGFQILLDNQREGYLTEACGRTWSILTNDAVEYNSYFCMVSSLLTGCLYTEIYGSARFTGWRIDVDAGHPWSDLAVEGRADSALTYRREFSLGEARISFASYGGRTETVFDADAPQ